MAVRCVNRERAKQALAEIGYEEFRLWLKVYLQMAPTPTQAFTGSDSTGSSTCCVIASGASWSRRYPMRGSSDQVLSEVRQAIYREYGCIDRKSVPFLG